jgi:hypothetical protein
MSTLDSGLPLLIVIEGENDVHFLKAISAVLHRDSPDLPDLAQLTSQRRAIFLPTGGSNLKEWATRIASLQKRTFYLFDREKEPETSQRKEVVEAVNQRAGCHAVMTSKRAVENFLHPHAILEACGIDLAFDAESDVASLLALRLMTRSGESSWRQLSVKRQRRLHDKAKKILNVKAVPRMTPALLAEQDPGGEIIGWLKMIGQLIGVNEPSGAQRPFSERELATVLAALRYWQHDLAENDGPISEHFTEHSPLMVEEIDDLCERLNCDSAAK